MLYRSLCFKQAAINFQNWRALAIVMCEHVIRSTRISLASNFHVICIRCTCLDDLYLTYESYLGYAKEKQACDTLNKSVERARRAKTLSWSVTT